MLLHSVILPCPLHISKYPHSAISNYPYSASQGKWCAISKQVCILNIVNFLAEQALRHINFTYALKYFSKTFSGEASRRELRSEITSKALVWHAKWAWCPANSKATAHENCKLSNKSQNLNLKWIVPCCSVHSETYPSVPWIVCWILTYNCVTWYIHAVWV